MSVALNGAAPPAMTVMITGVSCGIGHSLALEMARRGHTVIGCARSDDKILSLQSEITPTADATIFSSSSAASNHLLFHLDRSDNNIQELAKLAAETKQVPDIIAINKNNKIWEVPAEEFDMVIDTNIKGITNVLRYFLPLMMEKKQGVTVNMSSGCGKSAAAQVAPYCASKWVIEGLSWSVAKELPLGLAIVALSPGVVNTEMLASCFGSSAAQYQTPEAWYYPPLMGI